jgi:hypothetical protein
MREKTHDINIFLGFAFYANIEENNDGLLAIIPKYFEKYEIFHIIYDIEKNGYNKRQLFVVGDFFFFGPRLTTPQQNDDIIVNKVEYGYYPPEYSDDEYSDDSSESECSCDDGEDRVIEKTKEICQQIKNIELVQCGQFEILIRNDKKFFYDTKKTFNTFKTREEEFDYIHRIE